MTILLVTLVSIIITFLLYLAVNYKRVDITYKQSYNVLFGLGILYSNLDGRNIFDFLLLGFRIKITVWDEIRDLPF